MSTTTLIIDNSSKIAHVITAAIALGLSCAAYFRDKNQDKNSTYRYLLFDHKIKYLYEFYEGIQKVLEKLKKNDLSNKQKENINTDINIHLKHLRMNFIDLILAIDETLYDEVLAKADRLIDEITSAMFDNGLNLSDESKFEEMITSKITVNQTQQIKALLSFFNY